MAFGLLSVLQWARGRYAQCVRDARRSAGEESRAWLEDARYFDALVRQLEGSEGVMASTTVRMGQAVVLVREDGYARDALVLTWRVEPGGSPDQQPTLDCLVVNDQGTIETHAHVRHTTEAAPMTTAWRRTSDHRTTGEFQYESAR